MRTESAIYKKIRKGAVSCMGTEFGENLRKILLAGLGAAAVTAEKSKQVIDELVQKGELTLDQGKVLNEELKRNVKDQVKKHVTVTVTQTAPADVQSVADAVSKMSAEDLEKIKSAVAAREKAREADDPKGHAAE